MFNKISSFKILKFPYKQNKMRNKNFTLKILHINLAIKVYSYQTSSTDSLAIVSSIKLKNISYTVAKCLKQLAFYTNPYNFVSCLI